MRAAPSMPIVHPMSKPMHQTGYNIPPHMRGLPSLQGFAAGNSPFFPQMQHPTSTTATHAQPQQMASISWAGQPKHPTIESFRNPAAAIHQKSSKPLPPLATVASAHQAKPSLSSPYQLPFSPSTGLSKLSFNPETPAQEMMEQVRISRKSFTNKCSFSRLHKPSWSHPTTEWLSLLQLISPLFLPLASGQSLLPNSHLPTQRNKSQRAKL